MAELILRDAVEADFPSILAINHIEEQKTSAMDGARLAELRGMAHYCLVAEIDGEVAAFVLAFREGAAYQNVNYEWFAARYPRFIYVDRIVVSRDFAGRKIGAQLYSALFADAQAKEIPYITCEYNIQPPNPASQAFHDKFGFQEVGSQWVANGSKQVSLQVASVPDQA
ncbi:GNAT family N-acetyltransferase [Undibacterium fentianense]|uniref:GNAT family N-acetyltransferase n=1 Tax=Undibacterium fentianense TaxID=2828728 RepID=A0A941DZ35_9BURK|nr:GNAT family N-acetyltransferase [Undibacterium fentianense]MBR7800124.1 GNAT family N-acetyltransferase [Undibacterium fentianense]